MSFVAAAATVGTAVGLSGTAAVIGGGMLIGAGVGAVGGGLYSGLTGDGDIGESMLYGGLGGAALGGGYAAMAPAATVAPTVAPVSGAVAPAAIEGGAAATGFAGETTQAGMLAAQEAGMAVPQSQQAAMLAAQDAGFGGAQLSSAAGYQAPVAGSNLAGTTGSTVGNTAATEAAKTGAGKVAATTQGGLTGTDVALGTGALMYLTQKENSKYGVPTNEEYTGPLSKFNYDPKKYTALNTAQPNPAYSPNYANYRANPYAAAKGGVVAMADGGIAMANPSIGPVEQMSRDNATGNNMMFPQAGINSPAFASATNRPMAQNMVPSAADTSVDPYTGTERFAEGGIAATPEAQARPVPSLPSQITQNSVNSNNALMARLQGALVSPQVQQTLAQNPLQQAPVQAQPYGMPTFTRPTNIAPTTFAYPAAIPGTTAYNTEQARLAAEEQARQAAAAGATRPSDGASGEAAGGLMQSYAAGGGVGHLGGYAAGGNPRLLKGPGDGMSDNIPATIGGKQPARLADGEFVVPADVVSHLGNGSTDAGAKHLYNMMDKVRKARTGNKKQGKQIKPQKYMPK